MRKIILLIFCFHTLLAKSDVTTINGLTVIVEFSDQKLAASNNEISSMMNQQNGFNKWNNIGSVREFYEKESNGKIVLNTQVIRVLLNKQVRYYDNTQNFNGRQELVNDVVSAINLKYPNGFTNLTSHPNSNRLWFFLMIKADTNGGGVAYGVRDFNKIKNNNIDLPIKTACFASYGNNNPSISVVCHELGHHLFGWTDYYNNNSTTATNLGHYCLMGSGGSSTTPHSINPALRHLENWIPNIIEIPDNTTSTYTVNANSRTSVYKFTNSFNPKEYYLIEALVHGDYYTAIDNNGYPMDEGLAIWYVDEEGNAPYPKIKLVQADGLDEMHDINKSHNDHRGDLSDLFDNSFNSFNSELYPIFTWKDGSHSGLYITNVSTPSSTMTFRVNARENTITATSNMNGSILPKGLLNVSNGQSQKFDFVPSIGYGISDILVDGVSQGPIDSFTFNNVNSDHSINAIFQPITTVLPNPWQDTNIGNTITPSKIDYVNGTFKIETFGQDIYWNNDDFSYIYRPLNGNGEIIAKVSDLTGLHGWIKGGLMIRENLFDNSKHIMIVKTKSNGIASQFRINTGGASDNVNNSSLSNIEWLKVKRSNSTFTTYYSSNGEDWTILDTRTISMNNDVYVGLCASGANSNTPVKATFENVAVSGDTFNISATSNNNGGSVSGSGTYNYSQNVTVVATANTGYSFKNWTENGTQVSTLPSYTFNATLNRSLTANFEIKTFAVSVLSNDNNGGSVSGSGIYNYNQTVTAVATANTGYSFKNWTENGIEVSGLPSYTFNVLSEHNLVANFHIITGIDYEFQGSLVKISPNPNNGKFTIDFENEYLGNIIIKINSLVDTKTKIITINKNSKSVSYNVDISNEPKGVYIVVLQIGNEILAKKIIVN